MTKQRRAVYAGSFDPVTMGHRSVAARAATMFDEVICLVAVHPDKTCTFSPEERVRLLQISLQDLSNVRAAAWQGYTVQFARQASAQVLIRGIRGASDADYETRLSHLNQDLAPELTTVFVPADRQLSQVSSSALKQMVRQNHSVAAFCHPAVEEALVNALRPQRQMGT